MAPRDLSKSLQRTLAHLRPPPVKGGKFAMPIPSHFRPAAPFVQVKDRIPYWNIAPNDRVVVIKGGEAVKGKTGIVDRVERESNRVWLKESDFSVKKRQPNQYPGESLSPTYSGGDAASTFHTPRAFHVSNLRLEVESEGKAYVATRLRRSAVSWDRKQRRFSWKRWGLVTELADGESKGWVAIPWPQEDVPAVPAGGPLDTETPNTPASSWVPSLSSLSLHSTTAPTSPTKAASSPVPELNISPIDLHGGYHSRAKRTQRFNEKREEERRFQKGVAKEARESRGKRREALVDEVELA